MKRKILWKRLLILVGGVLVICLLGVVALFTVGRSLLSTLRAAAWTEDPLQARQAAQAMLAYQLPAGYAETKLLKVQGYTAGVLIPSSQRPGDLILLQSMVAEVRENESYRKRYEEGWSKDLDGHRYQVHTLEIRQMRIAGADVPLRLLDGTDESGRQVKQAVCILPGKAGDVLVAMMSSVETWDQGVVDTFFQSLK